MGALVAVLRFLGHNFKQVLERFVEEVTFLLAEHYETVHRLEILPKHGLKTLCH